jgi:hypothetical protein
MGRFTRRQDIDRRRRRRTKIAKLKLKLAKVQDRNDLDKIMDKIHKIHPFYPMATKAA